MTRTILVAPSGFKESLSVDEVTRAIGEPPLLTLLAQHRSLKDVHYR